MSLTVYNYHYIEMPEYPYSGIHSIKKEDFLNKVKTILESNGKFPTKVSMGDNYHKMKDITGKLND